MPCFGYHKGHAGEEEEFRFTHYSFESRISITSLTSFNTPSSSHLTSSSNNLSTDLTTPACGAIFRAFLNVSIARPDRFSPRVSPPVRLSVKPVRSFTRINPHNANP